ncbi:MAG: acyclic terpene utilization AtuA family protein [Gammaproteobacteria bacterium]
MKDVVRIGCGAGFWGDSPAGAAQLVAHGRLDYLVMDYLAEITMSILARMKSADANAGYATDFVGAVMQPLLGDIARQGLRVVTNAGGVNPLACKAALEALIGAAGLSLRVAAVSGDDLGGQVDALRAADVRELDTGAQLPAKLASMNAYLGATPIAAALAAGADIVVTGRCVDSALVLGPLMHEFGWQATDYDRLAAGSLAGHVIECGTQCTGGLFTDWETVPGWDDMGFPIAECAPDGSFVLSKPDGTGGLISPATVAEQITYEIGDPAHYLLPDVCCDFSAVRVREVGPDRVRIEGARGHAPSATYKVSATWADGYRCTATMMIGGHQARAKGERVAAAILARTRAQFAARGLGDYRETSVEILGAESTYGPHSRALDTREVVVKLGVAHADKRALELFAREIFPAATAMAQGLTGFAGGRPTVQPVVRLFSCLVPKTTVTAEVVLEDLRLAVAAPPGEHTPPGAGPTDATSADEAVADLATVPLRRLAYARSGDKGDRANIGLIARHPEFVPVLAREVTASAVAAWFGHLAQGPVTRYPWPGLAAFNFVLERALGGGGVASLRHDPQGKTYGQMLLEMPVQVPAAWAGKGGILPPQP